MLGVLVEPEWRKLASIIDVNISFAKFETGECNSEEPQNITDHPGGWLPWVHIGRRVLKINASVAKIGQATP